MVRSCLQSRRCLDELMLFVSFQILGYRHSQSLQVLLVFSMGSTKSYTTSREASSSIFLYFHDYSHSDLEQFFFHPYWYIYGRPEGRRLHQRWRETWVICIGSRTMSYRNSTVAFEATPPMSRPGTGTNWGQMHEYVMGEWLALHFFSNMWQVSATLDSLPGL